VARDFGLLDFYLYDLCMAINKVLLYYGFAPVADPAAVKLWQKTLCQSLNLKGRIIISPDGINGTIGGELNDLKKYVKETKHYPGFGGIDFKWSSGNGNDFPRLQVRVRPELVSFGSPYEIKVTEKGIENGGVHLTPHGVNELVAQKGDEVVFFDGRNAYEAKIGKFKNAVVPEVSTSHDFIAEIESGKYDDLKDKEVITYCTGGIRCEILTAVMKNRGFKNVYQIKGGIFRYGETYKNDGLWEGSLYTFDGRKVIDFSEDPEIIGECEICHAKTKSFVNCEVAECHNEVLLCLHCAKLTKNRYCIEIHAKVAIPAQR
jgi:UPF0176 protein